MFILDSVEKLFEEFIVAMVNDLNDPVIQKQLQRQIDSQLQQIQNPIVRSFAKDYTYKVIGKVEDMASPLIDLVKSDPPDSVDISAKIVKDTVSDKITNLADRIKLELAKKQENQSSIQEDLK